MNAPNPEKKETPKAPRGVAGDIMEFAKKMGEGKPFSTCELAHLGKRAALDQALSRLVRAGTLARVRRGMYVLPEWSDLFGEYLPPSVDDVLFAVSRATGERFEASAETALSSLRLTTQNQAHMVFSTSGKTRVMRFDTVPDIKFKHVSPRRLGGLYGSEAGMALVGLLHLGKSDVDEDVMKRVREGISDKEFGRLLKQRKTMPFWLAEKISLFVPDFIFEEDENIA